MDLYQIIITHNRAWTIRELIYFSIVMLIALIVGIHFTRIGRIGVMQLVSGLLALIFLGIVFGSTVFTRNPGVRQYQLEVFWSWKAILEEGQAKGGITLSASARSLLEENLLNMLLLFPLGVLLPFICGKKAAVWKGLLTGLFVSAWIEFLQLWLCRGLFEFDDMIHNAIGCMAGWAVGNLFICVIRGKRHKNG